MKCLANTGQKFKINMAVYRIQKDAQLLPQMRLVYINYLRKYSKIIVTQAIEGDNVAYLGFMGKHQLIGKSNMEYYIHLASLKKGRCTGYLLDYKQKYFGKSGKRFSL